MSAANLEPEIVLTIALAIPLAMSVARMASTCVAWRRAIELGSDSLWKALLEETFPSAKGLLQLAELKTAPDLHHVLYRRWLFATRFNFCVDSLNDFELTVDTWCRKFGSVTPKLLGSVKYSADELIDARFDPGCCSDEYTLKSFLKDAMNDSIRIGVTVCVSCTIFDLEQCLGGGREKVERTMTIELYNDELMEFDAEEDEWSFERQSISDFAVPGALADELNLFMHPTLHKEDGFLSLRFDGSWETGWSIEDCNGSSFGEDAVLNFFSTGIPWQRVPRDDAVHPLRQLRPAPALHKAMRKTDFLLSVEICRNGKVCAVQSGRAADMQNQAFTLQTRGCNTDNWLMDFLNRDPSHEALDCDITCKVFVVNNQRLDLNIAQIYPGKDCSGELQMDFSEEVSHLEIQEILFEEIWCDHGSWVSEIAEAYLQISPRLELKSDWEKTGDIGFAIDFEVRHEGGTIGLDEEEILEWFDDGIPWHYAHRAIM